MTNPESITDSDHISQVLNGLPLERCELKYNPVSDNNAWYAPKDHIFKVTGHFVVSYNSSDPYCMPYPIPSAALLKSEHTEEYEDLLIEYDGNEEKALNHLIDDESSGICKSVPKIFLGKWLGYYQEFTHNPTLENENCHTVIHHLTVKKDVEAWAGNRFFWCPKHSFN